MFLAAYIIITREFQSYIVIIKYERLSTQGHDAKDEHKQISTVSSTVLAQMWIPESKRQARNIIIQ